MENRIDEFKRLLDQHPDDELLWFSLGREFSKAGLVPAAVEAWRRALTIKPNYTTVYRELGNALLSLNEPHEAKIIFLKGIATAEATGDLQVKKEIEIFLKRIGD